MSDNEIKVIMPVSCRLCHKVINLEFNTDTYLRFMKWRDGQDNIQHLLYDLSADERELLISQTCGECWDKLFGEDEDYE